MSTILVCCRGLIGLIASWFVLNSLILNIALAKQPTPPLGLRADDVSTTSLASLFSTLDQVYWERGADGETMVHFDEDAPFTSLTSFQQGWLDSVGSRLLNGEALEDILNDTQMNRYREIKRLLDWSLKDPLIQNFEIGLEKKLAEKQLQRPALAVSSSGSFLLTDEQGAVLSNATQVKLYAAFWEYLEDPLPYLLEGRPWQGSMHSWMVFLALYDTVFGPLAKMQADPLFHLFAFVEGDSDVLLDQAIAFLGSRATGYSVWLDHLALYREHLPEVYEAFRLQTKLPWYGTDGLSPLQPGTQRFWAALVERAERDYREVCGAVEMVRSGEAHLIDFADLLTNRLPKSLDVFLSRDELATKSYTHVPRRSRHQHQHALQDIQKSLESDREFGDPSPKPAFAVRAMTSIKLTGAIGYCGQLVALDFEDKIIGHSHDLTAMQVIHPATTLIDAPTLAVNITDAPDRGGRVFFTPSQFFSYVAQVAELMPTSQQQTQNAISDLALPLPFAKATNLGKLAEAKKLTAWGANVRGLRSVPVAVAAGRPARFYQGGILLGASMVIGGSIWDSVQTGELVVPTLTQVLIAGRDVGASLLTLQIGLVASGGLNIPKIPAMASAVLRHRVAQGAVLFSSGAAFTQATGGSFGESVETGLQAVALRHLPANFFAHEAAAFAGGMVAHAIDGESTADSGRQHSSIWDAGGSRAASRMGVSGFAATGAFRPSARTGQPGSLHQGPGSHLRPDPMQGAASPIVDYHGTGARVLRPLASPLPQTPGMALSEPLAIGFNTLAPSFFTAALTEVHSHAVAAASPVAAASIGGVAPGVFYITKDKWEEHEEKRQASDEGFERYRQNIGLPPPTAGLWNAYPRLEALGHLPEIVESDDTNRIEASMIDDENSSPAASDGEASYRETPDIRPEIVDEAAGYIVHNRGPDENGRAHPSKRINVHELRDALVIAKTRGLSADWQVYHFRYVTDLWYLPGVLDQVIVKHVDAIKDTKYNGDLNKLIAEATARELVRTPYIDEVDGETIKIPLPAAVIGTGFSMIWRYIVKVGLEEDYKELQPVHMAKAGKGSWEADTVHEYAAKRVAQLLETEKYDGDLNKLIEETGAKELFNGNGELPFVEVIAGHPFEVSMGTLGVSLQTPNSPFAMVWHYIESEGLEEDYAGLRSLHMAQGSRGEWDDDTVHEYAARRVAQLLETEKYDGDLNKLIEETDEYELFNKGDPRTPRSPSSGPFVEVIAGHPFEVSMLSLSVHIEPQNSPFAMVWHYIESEGLEEDYAGLRSLHMGRGGQGVWDADTVHEYAVKKVAHLLASESYSGDLDKLIAESTVEELFGEPYREEIAGHSFEVSMQSLAGYLKPKSSRVAMIWHFIEEHNLVENYGYLRPGNG